MTNPPATLKPMADKLNRRSMLGPAERAALLSLPHRIEKLDRAQYIAREGEHLPYCCVLLSGFACCHKMTSDGARQVTSIHMAGDLLDIQDGASEIATCNVQPLGPVKLAYIPRNALFALAAAQPGIAAALWADTGANASVLAEWLLNVGRRNARSRIAHLICEVAVRQQVAGISRGIEDCTWAMTQEQLGDATGLTSVHVNRTMQGLRREGLLDAGHRQVKVSDWPGLRKAGDFTPGYLQLGVGADGVAPPTAPAAARGNPRHDAMTS